MGFLLDTLKNEIQTQDGLPVGRMGNGSMTFDLTVKGEPEQLLQFLRAVASAYEKIHPPGAYIDVFIAEDDGDTAWQGEQLLEEQTVKVKGTVIRVHMNDADHWPSDLHGHVQNRPGQKVDIYTGEIFSISGRKNVGSLGKKDLARLQAELRKSDWAAAKLDARNKT